MDGNDPMPRVSEATDLYLRSRAAAGAINDDTAAKLGGALRRMAEACGDPKIGKVDKDYAEQYLASIAGLKRSTRRWCWSTANAFMEWCVDEELVDRNPFRRVQPPKPPRRVPRPFTADEVARTLDAARRHDGTRGVLVVMLMVQQGFRCKGVAGVRVEQVDLEGRWMRVVEKGDHERVLWITDECAAAIADYWDEFPPLRHGPLIRAWQPPGDTSAGIKPRIPTDRGLSAGAVSKFVTEWLYAAKVKTGPGDGKTPHALRHTCATDMLDNGATMEEVGETLGHRDLSTTQIYAKVRPERLVGAMGGRSYSPTPAAPAVEGGEDTDDRAPGEERAPRDEGQYRDPEDQPGDRLAHAAGL